MSDKARLSPEWAEEYKPVGGRIRSDDEILGAALRFTRAVGKRCAEGDPDSAVYLLMVREEVDRQFAAAVAGWRASGFSDTAIGVELGVSKQAVSQRWPRS